MATYQLVISFAYPYKPKTETFTEPDDASAKYRAAQTHFDQARECTSQLSSGGRLVATFDENDWRA